MNKDEKRALGSAALHRKELRRKRLMDNNASELLFKHCGKPKAIEKYMRIPAAIPADARIVHKTGTGFPSAEGLQDMNDAGIILMPDGSHVIIAIFTKQSSSEAVIVNIAKQLLERIR